MSFAAVARHIASGRNSDWPDGTRAVTTNVTLPKVNRGEISITFINHATLLVRSFDTAVLTDPVWSTKVGPFPWAGPKRAVEPGIAMSRLPHVDAVVISHNHYDHLDLPTLIQLKEHSNPVFVVPLGNAGVIREHVSENVIELDWWASYKVGEGSSILLTPSRHNSGRGLFDRDESLWGSYAIFLGGKNYVYFAGDTAYSSHFSEIYRRLGNPTIALLPIGAYEPNERMREFHMNPKEAVQAHIDLKSRTSVAMHFGAFNLTAEAIDAPARDLKQAIAHNPESLPFRMLAEGETLSIKLSDKGAKR